MNWYQYQDRAAQEAHARLSLALPVHFHSPLKINQPLEKDEEERGSKEAYVPAWARKRSVWDV